MAIIEGHPLQPEELQAPDREGLRAVGIQPIDSELDKMSVQEGAESAFFCTPESIVQDAMVALVEERMAELHEQNELRNPFEFDLKGHELIDPVMQRGEVIGVQPVEPLSLAGKELPIGIRVHEITVRDPYTTVDPEGLRLVTEYVEGMEQAIRATGFNPLEERLKEHPYTREDGEFNEDEQRGNTFTDRWLTQESHASLRRWHGNVPTAQALGYLTDPVVGAEITDKFGNEPEIASPETTAHLRFVADAIAIRNRAIAMQEIAEVHLAGLERTGKPARWLSLASGTAEPSIAAAKATEDVHGISVDLTVVDLDRSSLRYVEQNAEKYGLKNVHTHKMNILKPTLKEDLAKRTGTEEEYDVVELLGFEEYLYEPGDELGAGKQIPGLPHASVFTRRAFDLVKPGGALISGNMVLPRPQSDFVFGVVDWPIINARSEESILRVYENAGILDDPNARVELFRVKDEVTGGHVYDIVKVSKLPVPGIEGSDQVTVAA